MRNRILRRVLIAAGLTAPILASAPVSAQTIALCNSNLAIRSQFKGQTSSQLGASANTPCRVNVVVTAASPGAPIIPGAGFTITSQPKHGRATAEGPTSLIFTPNDGFKGSDVMQATFAWQDGGATRVRFVIRVR